MKPELYSTLFVKKKTKPNPVHSNVVTCSGADRKKKKFDPDGAACSLTCHYRQNTLRRLSAWG